MLEGSGYLHDEWLALFVVASFNKRGTLADSNSRQSMAEGPTLTIPPPQTLLDGPQLCNTLRYKFDRCCSLSLILIIYSQQSRSALKLSKRLSIIIIAMFLQCSVHISQALISTVSKPRQALRERCGNTLAIQTPSHVQFLQSLDCDCLFQALEPYARTNRHTLREHQEGNAEEDNELFYTPYESPTDFPPDNSHLWNPIDSLYLAFADDNWDEATLRTHAGEPFSHVVKIVHVPDDSTSVTLNAVEEIQGNGGSPHILCLSCRSHAFRSEGVEPGQCTGLSPTQLLAARDFLSLVLPFQCPDTPTQIPPKPQQQIYPDPNTYRPNSKEHVRLLVIAPRGRAADVMSVVVCYLAFTSEMPTSTVSEYVSRVADCDDVWLSDPCTILDVEHLESIARLP